MPPSVEESHSVRRRSLSLVAASCSVILYNIRTLSGPIAAALMAQASELLAQPPVIEKVDVLAAKLPGGA